MTETQVGSPATPGNRAVRFTAFLFGVVAYLTFLFTIMYAIGFISGLAVPKTVDTGAKSWMFEAIVVNLALMALFAVQHSAMARKSSKHWWAQFIPGAVERSAHRRYRERVSMLFPWRGLS
jgi:protein-S-isoprenylcysteine O-methyltransferase Ste14